MMAATLRAPAGHGEILIEPPPRDWPSLVAENARLWQKNEVAFCQVPLVDWRRHMRATAQAIASAQLGSWGRACAWPEAGWLVTGHQPELFHPGVWAKHFALGEAAPRLALAPLNLIADHDQPKTLALRVPARVDGRLTATWIPFCEANPVLAWEEYQVVLDTDASESSAAQVCDNQEIQGETVANLPNCSRKFQNLAQRAVAQAGDLLPEMILPRFWSQLLSLVERWGRRCPLAQALAGARRLWEERWGYHNAEVCVSALSSVEPFLAFVGEVLAHLPAFVSTHNAELSAFRREHDIRSRTHPVPPLWSHVDWHEAPFWVWCPGQPRQRLWVKHSPGVWILRLGEHGPTLRIPPARHPQDLSEFAQALRQAGWKIRPRALTLTLFIRLFLAELFIHGIGGGIYDRFTDRLMARFWRITPPRYAIVSATLRLPLPQPAPQAMTREELLHRLRDCRFNPERVLPRELLARPEIQHLIERKRQLVRQWPIADLSQRRRLHQELTEIREALRPLAKDAEAQLRAHEAAWAAYQEQLALVQDREWAFVLYSDSALTLLVERVREAFAKLSV